MGDTPPPFAACDRKAPYVFVSYAQKDKADVYPDIQHLHDSGFRIWYDEGITPSEEWQENIASAIDGCAMFVVFLSTAAVESKWVNREISYAVNRDKPFLAVHLVKMNLPSKLDLTIGIYQHVIMPGTSRDVYLGKVKAVLPTDTNNLVCANVKDVLDAQLPKNVPMVSPSYPGGRIPLSPEDQERRNNIDKYDYLVRVGLHELKINKIEDAKKNFQEAKDLAKKEMDVGLTNKIESILLEIEKKHTFAKKIYDACLKILNTREY
jgi:hypothetical protein